MNSITVYRPDQIQAVPDPIPLAPRRKLAERPVVGLIANGKPFAKEVLGALARQIEIEIGREVDVELLSKPSAAYVISAEEADVMAARAHVVISGLGD